MKIEKGKGNKKDLSVMTEEIGERTVRFTISKEVTDRDGDILRANGVDFGNYMKNPVFLGFHNSRDFPLGKVVKFWVEGDSVKADVYFPKLEELSSDMNNVSEKARLIDFCFHCYKTGMLNAVSVGFIPLEWIETEKGFDIFKWELLEFSAVAVPANQDAIAEAVKSFGDEFAKGFVSKMESVEKDGRRISASTRKVLDAIKSCGDEIEKCRNDLKKIVSTMNELLAELDDMEEEVGEDVELPESPEKEFDLAKIK